MAIKYNKKTMQQEDLEERIFFSNLIRWLVVGVGLALIAILYLNINMINVYFNSPGGR